MLFLLGLLIPFAGYAAFKIYKVYTGLGPRL